MQRLFPINRKQPLRLFIFDEFIPKQDLRQYLFL